MTLLHDYKNGNAQVRLYSDGTRTIDYEGETLQLEWPLNIDIRTSTRCAFGRNPATGKAVCEFCHESATTDGVECDYEALAKVLQPLPAGIELAIGVNHTSVALMGFLWTCKERGHVVNVTVNQGFLPKLEAPDSTVDPFLWDELVHGVGISYRKGFRDIPKWLVDSPNTVVHVIAGIDPIEDVLALANVGVKKVLVLGEKDFGFNAGCVSLESDTHFNWRCYLPELLKAFDVVSFDNLALQQLRPQRFFTEETWRPLYQGEYSFYINAVDQTFSPSSRSPEKSSYGDIREYFKATQKETQ